MTSEMFISVIAFLALSISLAAILISTGILMTRVDPVEIRRLKIANEDLRIALNKSQANQRQPDPNPANP